VGLVALLIAVPLGVGAAIYVNQIASVREQRIIKPCIEFISAIPSVVLGFFGIVVFGEALRQLSQVSWLSWVPGFPYSERLNVLTAGCLLALIAVPTIFTLAEDALNNVPRAFKEASYALGASRLQTIIKIIVPASLSGIIAAVLLGLGRVIGETMVVLLCAGNRIAIPDFSRGLAVVTEPVHTMTGIIAQEMGEVASGSIHYRALFMVGLVLFMLSLSINYAAQKIVQRYRISIG
jgi:phosphate transport system permease protein